MDGRRQGGRVIRWKMINNPSGRVSEGARKCPWEQELYRKLLGPRSSELCKTRQ